MKKEVKTNVMRILEKEKVDYEAHYYPHGKEAVDGVTVAELTGQNPDYVFKTLVTVSNKKEYFVFVIPVAEELDLKKAAKTSIYAKKSEKDVNYYQCYALTVTDQNFVKTVNVIYKDQSADTVFYNAVCQRFDKHIRICR